MSTDTIYWYPSKVDWWMALLLCVPPVASVAVCVAMAAGGRAAEWPAGLAAVLTVLGIYVGFVFPMCYGMDDTYLIVRFGVCRQRIPLANITDVRPTRNLLTSSLALSLDRHRVQYGPSFFQAVMISPADRERFLDELAQKAGLTRDRERLVRYSAFGSGEGERPGDNQLTCRDT
jgi:hypothetical protein